MRPGRYTIVSVIGGVVLLLAVGAITVFALGGFNRQDRTALARQAVQTYWLDIEHGKVSQAYAMLTAGNQQAIQFSSYSQSMYSFLEGTGGIAPIVGAVSVNGDTATVQVSLHSPKSAQDLHAYQHLFWDGSRWRISDENGGLTHTR